ncbi:ArsR family transcriptional regulator [Halorubrum sp. SD626R]|jgi:DNA-binding transcriptional ArsR family regulator|nr:ArsR family transcriptional regulator [Halorubrum sp. SD626R]
MVKMSSFDTESEDSQSIEQILNALSVETNRKILSALNKPMTAAELVDECDLSTSTVYRKLDRLSNSGLIKEHLAVDSENGRCSQYERNIERVSVSLSSDGRMTIQVEQPSGRRRKKKTWKPYEK